MKRIFLFLWVLLCLLCAAACAGADSLTYTLLEDGSGYEITACDVSAESVTIPAEHEGLPVLSIAGEAFLTCEQLREFRTEAGHPVFYAEDGVLFTDEPVKTLVRFPNAYPLKYYQAPADTKAVAPWAFSGQSTLFWLHFQEGLESFGEHMLDSANCWMVYVPDSLKSIGEGLLQNEKESISFYGSEDCLFYQFACEQNIPYGMIMPVEPKEQTVELAEPDLTEAEGLRKPGKDVRIPQGQYLMMNYDYMNMYAFDGAQVQDDTELRMDLGGEWKDITPDAEGKVADGMDPRTGLYGFGFTEAEAVLRGYDREGSLTGTRLVSGDFIFSLPGAYTVGITGGKNMRLNIMPYQPAVIASAGTLPLDPEEFHYLDEGSRVQYFVIPFSYASASFDCPSYLNICSRMLMDTMGDAPAEDSPHYAVVCATLQDPYLLDQAGLISVSFDHLGVLYETEEFTCTAASRYGLDEEFAKNIAGVLDVVKATMSGVYYPAEKEINHVTVRVNGDYPACDHSTITLDDYLTEYNDGNVQSFAHEMVHAVDQSFDRYLPGAWMEGRAEYISRKVCDTMGTEYWNYDEDFDWAFLSAEDRADFFLYYTEHVNHETMYSVGYFFFKYLCETYGEDVSAQIMRNLFDAAEGMDWEEMQVPGDVFKKCVTDATDPDVFRNFVRDVVEQ